MNSIIELIETAKTKQGLTSDRQLAKTISVNQKSISQWRHGISAPIDKHVIELAVLAGIPAHEAVLKVALIKADETVKPIYEDILKKMTGAIAITAVSSMLLTAKPAGASPATSVNLDKETMYIMENRYNL